MRPCLRGASGYRAASRTGIGGVEHRVILACDQLGFEAGQFLLGGKKMDFAVCLNGNGAGIGRCHLAVFKDSCAGVADGEVAIQSNAMQGCCREGRVLGARSINVDAIFLVIDDGRPVGVVAVIMIDAAAEEAAGVQFDRRSRGNGFFQMGLDRIR